MLDLGIVFYLTLTIKIIRNQQEKYSIFSWNQQLALAFSVMHFVIVHPLKK